jgi:hypothetical protein
VTTALDIITRALKVIQCLGDSETPTNTEATDCLVSLNAMLKTWSAQSLSVFKIEQDVFPLVVNQGTYTVGIGGNFNIERPTRLEPGSFARWQAVDYPLESIGREAYDGIRVKGTKGIPYVMFLDDDYPLANLTFYYVPIYAFELHLNQLADLTQFTSLTGTLNMPPEYEECLVFNLAIRIAPEFNGTVSPQVQMIASETKSTIRAINAQDLSIQTEIGRMGRGKFNINSGYSS